MLLLQQLFTGSSHLRGLIDQLAQIAQISTEIYLLPGPARAGGGPTQPCDTTEAALTCVQMICGDDQNSTTL